MKRLTVPPITEPHNSTQRPRQQVLFIDSILDVIVMKQQDGKDAICSMLTYCIGLETKEP